MDKLYARGMRFAFLRAVKIEGEYMDWFPLYNSLRIAAIACTLVFFLGIFVRVLYCQAAEGVQGSVGCSPDFAHGIAAHGMRLFFTDHFWTEASGGTAAGTVGNPLFHDLVRWYSGGCSRGVSPDVPNGQRCF